MRIVGVELSLNPALCTMEGMYTTAHNMMTLAGSRGNVTRGGGGQQSEPYRGRVPGVVVHGPLHLGSYHFILHRPFW